VLREVCRRLATLGETDYEDPCLVKAVIGGKPQAGTLLTCASMLTAKPETLISGLI
jgi:hypothetical protein